MTTDVAAICANLGSRQREVILKLPAGAKRRAIDFHGATAADLRLPKGDRPALVDRDIFHQHGRRTAVYWLTNDGLAVRAALQQNDEGDVA